MMQEGAYGYESQKTNLEERNYLETMQQVSTKLDSDWVGYFDHSFNIYYLEINYIQ